MDFKKYQQQWVAFDRRVMNSNNGSSNGAGSKKGSDEDPYTIAEFICMLQNGTWTGGYVIGMGYVAADIFIKSSEGISDDYGSDYGDDITRYYFSSHSSFDFDAYFGSIFSFMNEAPTSTPTGTSSSSSSNENSQRNFNVQHYSYKINDDLLIQIERMSYSNQLFFSITYKVLRPINELVISIKYRNDRYANYEFSQIKDERYVRPANSQPLANIAIYEGPDIYAEYSLVIRVNNDVSEQIII